jgi:hypothetical protein
MLALHPPLKLENHSLWAACDCVFNIFTAVLHIGGHSSIHYLRMCHAVVTKTHLPWIIFYTAENYLTAVSLISACITIVFYHNLCTHYRIKTVTLFIFKTKYKMHIFTTS